MWCISNIFFFCIKIEAHLICYSITDLDKGDWATWLEFSEQKCREKEVQQMECFVETSTMWINSFTLLCTLCIRNYTVLGDGTRYGCGIQLFNNINNNLCREMYTVIYTIFLGWKKWTNVRYLRWVLADACKYKHWIHYVHPTFVIWIHVLLRRVVLSSIRIVHCFRHFNYKIWSENQWIKLPQRVTDSNESFAKLAKCVYIVSTKSVLELIHHLTITLLFSLTVCVCMAMKFMDIQVTYSFHSLFDRGKFRMEHTIKAALTEIVIQKDTQKTREDWWYHIVRLFDRNLATTYSFIVFCEWKLFSTYLNSGEKITTKVDALWNCSKLEPEKERRDPLQLLTFCVHWNAKAHLTNGTTVQIKMRCLFTCYSSFAIYEFLW